MIGSKLASILDSFGATLFGCDPKGIPADLPFVKPIEWSNIPKKNDVVLLTCTHNESSHEMVNEQWLSRCEGMILINCARGKLIHYPSVLSALDGGQLMAIGLDVFPMEPHHDLHAVQHFDNILFTPHAAGYHPFLSSQIRETLFEIVNAWSNGRMLKHEVLEG